MKTRQKKPPRKQTPGGRFDLDFVRELAGDKVFARGVEYHRDGQVEILGIDSRRVLAQVAGTEDYRTELTGRGAAIDGSCSCPAFEDWGFCKHMVAVALAANEAGEGAAAEGGGALGRIRAHLKTKGVDALADMIVELAERDPALFRKLDIAATAADGDDKTVEARLRKTIDDATRTRGYVDYGAAQGWAAGVDAALDALNGIASGERAGLALGLAERAIDRIAQAIESMDDSDGHCGELMERACEIHQAAARAARPDPVRLAKDLFAREMEDDYDMFDGAAALYADVLVEAGLAEYRRLAVAEWEKLPARGGGRGDRGGYERSQEYDRLSRILDGFAERDGDVDARIALRAKDLSSAHRYVQLAAFCREQGRDDLALRYAEEGLWVFEDGRPDRGLLFLAADLLAKAKRKDDAGTLLWRAFEKAPSLDIYERLRKVGGAAARDRAVALLQSQVAKERRTGWEYPADLLVRVLLQEKMFDAGWAAVRQHGASPAVKHDLARASEAAFPRDALAAYAERVDQLANGGSNPTYADAVKLIRHMATLRDAAEQADYVASIKARFGRKRNFMKLLG